MPHKLVETLLKKSENMIKKLATTPLDGYQGSPQLLPVFDFLQQIIDNNNLIPAWHECMAFVRSNPGKYEKIVCTTGAACMACQGMQWHVLIGMRESYWAHGV